MAARCSTRAAADRRGDCQAVERGHRGRHRAVGDVQGPPGDQESPPGPRRSHPRLFDHAAPRWAAWSRLTGRPQSSGCARTRCSPSRRPWLARPRGRAASRCGASAVERKPSPSPAGAGGQHHQRRPPRRWQSRLPGPSDCADRRRQLRAVAQDVPGGSTPPPACSPSAASPRSRPTKGGFGSALEGNAAALGTAGRRACLDRGWLARGRLGGMSRPTRAGHRGRRRQLPAAEDEPGRDAEGEARRHPDGAARRMRPGDLGPLGDGEDRT